jgi:hypothetical protein
MVMHFKRPLAVGAVVAVGSVVALPAIASAAPSQSFVNAQTHLEQQIALRTTQLGRLSADVAASKTLSSAHATQLTVNITTAAANLKVLSAKVPTDTTFAQLRTDRSSMLVQNRVFAVLTPQVFETIGADAVAAQVVTLQADEPSLQASVTSLVGEHSYENALNHYLAFIRLVNSAAAASTNVATKVLAQTPADYPGDTHVFVSANKALLNANIDLAKANYNASILGLASGGYTGS